MDTDEAKKQREQGRATGNKCKNEGCNNARGYGSSRCLGCTKKYREENKKPA